MKKITIFKIKMLIGHMLYFLGFQYGISTGLGGELTRGYGRLDANGYWQFPIHSVEIMK